MPKKPVFPESDCYIVLYTIDGVQHWQECLGARSAVDIYRLMRDIYGDNVRLAKVVLNHGQEV